MPTVEIASNLNITTQFVQTDPEWRMGVEVSQPVLVLGTDVIAVAGEVSAAQAPSGVTCDLELQQSPDGRFWPSGQRITLPSAAGPFALTDVPVIGFFARVRWIILGPMTATTRWQVTATLSTGKG